MNNVVDILQNSISRILEYYKEYSNKDKNDEFKSGVKLGLRIALGVLQTDLEVFDINDDNIVKKVGLDIDLDDIV